MEWIIFLAMFLLSFVIIKAMRYRKRTKEYRRLPPSLPSLPLVGSLPFLRGLDKLPEFFMEKSKQLGPVFTLKIGRKLCLVLNNRAVLVEALVKKKLTFAGRESSTVEHQGCNLKRKGIIFKQFDAAFRRYHQLSLSILKEFGFGNRQLMESRILSELEALVHFIRSKRSEAFSPKETMSQATSNIIVNIVLGIREDYKDGFGKLVSQSEKMANNSDPSIDVAPILRFFPYFKRKYHDYCDASRSIIEIVDKHIEEMKSNPDTDSFVTRYLEKEGVDCDREQLLFTIRDFVIAGADTTASALCWSLVLLNNHPAVQKRVQDEIDSAVSRSRLPTLSDESNLPYTAATILEIMRFKTIIPLAVPHITLQDCDLGSYFVPANTMVIPNLYAAHMDPREWGDPEIFRPERFLNHNGGIINKDKVIPFSLGSRACIGEVLARPKLFLFFAGLLQNFIILPPDNQRYIDEEGEFGVAFHSKPFNIRMIPRD